VAETMWIVLRISVPWTTLRSKSALVSASPAQAGEPGPQADVTRRCVLGLEPTNLLDRHGEGKGAALQQVLAGQERPVEGRRERTSPVTAPRAARPSGPSATRSPPRPSVRRGRAATAAGR